MKTNMKGGRSMKFSLKALIDKNPMSQLYKEARLPKDIARSLNFILIGNIFGSITGIICGGGTASMVGLATELGASDIHFGLLTAIPNAAALMQIPFSVAVNRTHKRKLYMLTWGLISRAIWMLFGLIPLILPMASSMLQLWIIIFLLGISSCMGASINPCWFPWFSDLAPIHMRARWLSIRESFFAVGNVAIGMLVAYLLDHLPPESKYIIIFLIGGLAGVLDMVAFGFCKEVYSAPPQKQNIFAAMGSVFRNKPFMALTIMWTAWCFTANLSGAYLIPYSMNEMGLNNTQITLFFTIVPALCSFFVMQRWGRMLDRFGCRNLMLVTATVASLTSLFFLFSTPGNIFPALLHNLVGATFWCACNLVANNMQLSTSPDETRPTHIAVFSCITALAGGTLGSLLGGTLLDTWAAAGTFEGLFIDRYQALIILAVVLRFSCVMVFVPRLPKDSDSKPLDIVKFIIHSVTHPAPRMPKRG